MRLLRTQYRVDVNEHGQAINCMLSAVAKGGDSESNDNWPSTLTHSPLWDVRNVAPAHKFDTSGFNIDFKLEGKAEEGKKQEEEKKDDSGTASFAGATTGGGGPGKVGGVQLGKGPGATASGGLQAKVTEAVTGLVFTSKKADAEACTAAGISDGGFLATLDATFPEFPNLFDEAGVFATLKNFPQFGSFTGDRVIEENKAEGMNISFKQKELGEIKYHIPATKPGIYLVGDNLATNHIVLPGVRCAPNTSFGIFVDDKRNFYIFDEAVCYNHAIRMRLFKNAVTLEKHQIVEMGWEANQDNILAYAVIKATSSKDETQAKFVGDFSGQKLLSWKKPENPGATHEITLQSLFQQVEQTSIKTDDSKPTLKIGRNPTNDVQFTKFATISGDHCQITFDAASNKWVLIEPAKPATNGTYVYINDLQRIQAQKTSNLVPLPKEVQAPAIQVVMPFKTAKGAKPSFQIADCFYFTIN